MEKKPLLSNERIAQRVDEYVLPYRTEITRVAKEFRDDYEADRTRLLALLQTMTNALANARITEGDTEQTDSALSQAKEQFNIEPRP